MFSKRMTAMVGSIALLMGLSVISASTASAEHDLATLGTTPAAGTVDIKFEDGRTVVSAPIWSGQIPTQVRINAPKDTYSSSYKELSFAATALKTPEEMRDADVEVEVWDAVGNKLGSDQIYGFSWNPGGGPTMMEVTLYDLKPGTYTMYVKTEWELATNGLISRYVEGLQTLPLIVTEETYVICEKKKKPWEEKVFKKKKCPKKWRPAK